MNVDPEKKASCFGSPVQFFLATINSFTLSMAPLLCDCNCMFDHVTGHITEHTRNKLSSGTVLEQPPRAEQSIYTSAILCLIMSRPSSIIHSALTVTTCLFMLHTLIHPPPTVLLTAVVPIFLYFTLLIVFMLVHLKSMLISVALDQFCELLLGSSQN